MQQQCQQQQNLGTCSIGKDVPGASGVGLRSVVDREVRLPQSCCSGGSLGPWLGGPASAAALAAWQRMYQSTSERSVLTRHCRACAAAALLQHGACLLQAFERGVPGRKAGVCSWTSGHAWLIAFMAVADQTISTSRDALRLCSKPPLVWEVSPGTACLVAAVKLSSAQPVQGTLVSPHGTTLKGGASPTCGWLARLRTGWRSPQEPPARKVPGPGGPGPAPCAQTGWPPPGRSHS